MELKPAIERLALSDPHAAEVPFLREALHDVEASVAVLQSAFSAWDIAESTLLALGRVRGGLERDAAVLEGRLRQLRAAGEAVDATDRLSTGAIRRMGGFADPSVALLAAVWRAEATRATRLSRWASALEAETIELPETVPALTILRRLRGDARGHAQVLRESLLGLLHPGEESLLRELLGELAPKAGPRLGRSIRLLASSLFRRFAAPGLRPAAATTR